MMSWVGNGIFTGYELSDFEKGAIVVGLLTAGIGDDILQMGARASRYVDELGEGAEFAAKHAEELGDAARFATKHSDELADAVTWSARHGDDLSEARLAQRLDDYVSPNGAAARLGNETLENRRLAQRMDGYVARSDDTVRYANDTSAVRRADNSYGGSCAPARNSFTAGTLVETETGDKPIETIEAGDKVLGEEPETGEQGYFEVVSVRSHLKDEVVEVTIETDAGKETTQEVMETTPDHPVYVEEKGWIWAENLEAGDRLRTADDSWAEVVSIEHVQLDEPELVYNFTVRGPHTYFVLEVGVLVHNCKQNVELDG
ncbi:MAG: hypothetical protein GY796_20635, partial [Chloroflexi bacterium]|nr:hypothetical protein [Chloroflexota bacterium]